MTDTQILTIALSTAPTMLLVLVGILINNARLGDTNTRIGETNIRIGEIRSHMDVRFEEMKDLWRSELHRVEEVIDARLKHITRSLFRHRPFFAHLKNFELLMRPLAQHVGDEIVLLAGLVMHRY
jgi:hypothetical protein